MESYQEAFMDKTHLSAWLASFMRYLIHNRISGISESWFLIPSLLVWFWWAKETDRFFVFRVP